MLNYVLLFSLGSLMTSRLTMESKNDMAVKFTLSIQREYFVICMHNYFSGLGAYHSQTYKNHCSNEKSV